jgi:hypothetical protein
MPREGGESGLDRPDATEEVREWGWGLLRGLMPGPSRGLRSLSRPSEAMSCTKDGRVVMVAEVCFVQVAEVVKRCEGVRRARRRRVRRAGGSRKGCPAQVEMRSKQQEREESSRRDRLGCGARTVYICMLTSVP